MLSFLTTAGTLAADAFAQAGDVAIEGGPDPTGQTYIWTVTNKHTSAITQIEFPHYRASLFFPPAGWTGSCTNLVQVGAPDTGGVCTASAAESGGLAPQRSAEFRLQLASGAVQRGSGAAMVRFADGTGQEVPNVSIPTRESLGDRYVPLVGMGVVLLVLVAVHALRRRRGATPKL